MFLTNTPTIWKNTNLSQDFDMFLESKILLQEIFCSNEFQSTLQEICLHISNTSKCRK